MDYSTLTLLISLSQLLSVGTAAPLSVEVGKMKIKVKWMAEQLVAKLNNFQVIFVVLAVATESVVDTSFYNHHFNHVVSAGSCWLDT